MIELILVRHGQANSAGDNYDELTDAGREQARKVGAWFVASGYIFDRCFHGGLKRQAETLALIQEQYSRRRTADTMEKGPPAMEKHSQERGLAMEKRSQEPGVAADFHSGGAAQTNPLPAMEIHSGFAEFDFRVFYTLAAEMRSDAIFAAALKDWNKARRARTQAEHASQNSNTPERENARNKGEVFKRLMGLVIGEWMKRGESFTGAESFPTFARRVYSTLEISSDKPQRILAVTSGGPIALLVGRTLGLDTAQTLQLIRSIYNTSVHHIALEGDKRTLLSFNAMPHLALHERTLV